MLPAQLRQEWSDLRSKAILKLQQGVCSMDASDAELRQWDDILLRFRKLREGLTAARAPCGVSYEVYELSAVACAAARNMAELLKCLQQLVNSIYPEQQTATAAAGSAAQQQLLLVHGLQDTSTLHAAQQQESVQQQLQELHLQQQTAPTVLQANSCSSSASSCNAAYITHLMPPICDSSSNSGRCSYATDDASDTLIAAAQHQQHLQLLEQENVKMQQRQVEVAAALLLYFVCVPRRPVVQEIVKQLKIAAKCSLAAQNSTSNSHSSSKGATSSQAGSACRPELPATVIHCDSSCAGRPAGGQQQQHALQLLLDHPGYQLALQAAAAVLNCNWVRFRRCYEQRPPLLVRVVMECVLQRLRVHAVHTVVAAYRMLPSAVLERWLGLKINQQQQTQQQQQQQQQRLQQHPAGDESDEWDVELQLVNKRKMQALLLVLQSAADGGSKGAKVALEQCVVATTGLPDTLQFRA